MFFPQYSRALALLLSVSAAACGEPTAAPDAQSEDSSLTVIDDAQPDITEPASDTGVPERDAGLSMDSGVSPVMDARVADTGAVTDPCAVHSTCEPCTLAASCGFCAASNRCLTGTSTGPSATTCASGWAYVRSSCPAVDSGVPATMDARADATSDARVDTGVPPPATASFRYIDLTLRGTGTYTKLCLWQLGSAAPFVLADRGHAQTEATYTVPATYATTTLPTSGRFDYFQVVERSGTPETTAAGCDRAMATDFFFNARGLRGDGSIRANNHHTFLRTSVSPMGRMRCDTVSTDTFCRYFPRTDASRPYVNCADANLYLLRDGSTAGGGIRTFNLTRNASSVTFDRGTSALGGNDHAERSLRGDEGYLASPSATLKACPQFVQCQRSVFASNSEYLAAAGCRNAWPLGTVMSSRFTSSTQFTSVYVVGDAPALASDGSRLVGTPVQIVIANDVTN
jgi:hypothetical protein